MDERRKSFLHFLPLVVVLHFLLSTLYFLGRAAPAVHLVRTHPASMLALTINVGSSSLKSAVFDANADGERRIFAATLSTRGKEMTALVTRADGSAREEAVQTVARDSGLSWLLARLEHDGLADRLTAVGHRLVHGGDRYRQPVWLTEDVLADLQGLIPLAPDHLPLELAAVETVTSRWPHVPSAASFDTAFHATLPDHARLFGLPRRFTDDGVKRFGFHGLSYEYVVGELRTSGVLPSRLVAAHLGNGASLAAIRDGESIDTTMGFTPAGGVVMATRSGDLDPGVLLYLARTQALDADALNLVVNVDGGLLGISGTTGDMRVLLERSRTDSRAAAAIDVFCYQVSKAVGSFATALGGLDAIVFTGGIGEHAAAIRAVVCERLRWCGVALDATRNAAHEPVISSPQSPVEVRIVPANEELMIARHLRVLVEKGEAHVAN